MIFWVRKSKVDWKLELYLEQLGNQKSWTKTFMKSVFVERAAKWIEQQNFPFKANDVLKFIFSYHFVFRSTANLL